MLVIENRKLIERQNSKLSIDFYVFGFIGLIASIFGIRSQENQGVNQ